MKKRLFRVVLYIVGAWISKERCAEPWVVGPVFGLVMAAWDASGIRDFFFSKRLPRRAVFLVLSTLIYALVFTIADMNWRLEPEKLEWVFGSVPLAVVLGSVLLPLAHRLTLGTANTAIVKAALLLAGSFYGVTWTGGLLDTIGILQDFDYYALAVYLWQGLYLKFLCASNPKET